MRRHPLIMIAVLAGGFTASALPANAKGTMVVTQSNGSQKVYNNVSIRVRGSAMSLTSSDGKDTLTIDKAACTPVNHLLRCVTDDAMLKQLGEARPLHLGSGTAWLDLSAKPHHLRLSFQTKGGATVTASGTIDEFHQ